MTSFVRLICGMLGCLVLTHTASAAPARTTMMQMMFGCTTKSCTVQQNLGGTPMMFELAAEDARKRGVQIRIDGRCASACVIFASRVRKNVCLTKNASMELHRGRAPRFIQSPGKQALSYQDIMQPSFGVVVEWEYMTPDYGDDINQWAFDNNKMPYEGTYKMTAAEAARYWKRCR